MNLPQLGGVSSISECITSEISTLALLETSNRCSKPSGAFCVVSSPKALLLLHPSCVQIFLSGRLIEGKQEADPLESCA